MCGGGGGGDGRGMVSVVEVVVDVDILLLSYMFHYRNPFLKSHNLYLLPKMCSDLIVIN